MTTRYLLAPILALAVACSANPSPSTGRMRPGDLIAIQQGARGSSVRSTVVSEASVRSHMEFLASDALNGRGSGTREEWMAAEYIAAQFSAWGLEPLGDEGGFVQKIALAGYEATGPPVVEAGELRFTHGRDILAGNVGRPTISGQLVKYAGEESVPMGSVVLLPPGEPARQVTGAVLVIAEAGERDREQWTTRAARLPRVSTEITEFVADPLPRATIILSTTETHAALGALIDRAEVTLRTPVAEPTRSYTWNVVASLTGSHERSADDVIVLSAHIDHIGICAEEGDTICNGADDNASGTVAVMELARAMASGPRPRRTIVFALFGSEERGGHGASHFVQLPVIPLESIIADIQFEMIGRPDEAVEPGELWLTGFERSDLGPTLAERGARLVADPHPEQNFFQRSDNFRFAREGIVAHTVSSFGLHEDYHRPSDEIRLIDFAHMTAAIQSMLEPIRGLANDEFRPEWAPDGRPR
ncbi:MAG TPA: M20/M25/M40 family metallo-hydrolase [Vicinamibacterales bacterium]|nr:M20/M25/M40 family metallo-hydrolase [Vicinamibacterales bacterium]